MNLIVTTKESWISYYRWRIFVLKRMDFAQERKRYESLHALCALNGDE